MLGLLLKLRYFCEWKLIFYKYIFYYLLKLFAYYLKQTAFFIDCGKHKNYARYLFAVAN